MLARPEGLGWCRFHSSADVWKTRGMSLRLSGVDGRKPRLLTAGWTQIRHTPPPSLFTLQTAGGPGVSAHNQFKVHFCVSILKENHKNPCSARSTTAVKGLVHRMRFVCVSAHLAHLTWLILPGSTRNHGNQCCSPRLCVRGVAASSNASRASWVSPFTMVVLIL